MEPIITTLLTLGAAGAGAAGVRYLWRLASGTATEHERLQAQVLIEHARHQHPLPPQHIALTHNPQYAPRITRSTAAATVPPLVEDTPTAAASAPTFAGLLAEGKIGQGCPIVVGQSPTGMLTATWGELYSTAIGGLSGSGKSWTAASLVAQSLLNGASVALVDPDAHDPNSLSARIAPLASRFLCDPAEEEPQIASLCALLTDELEARSKGTRKRRPLVVAIDEYNDLVRHIPALAALVDLIGRRGRRQHMFALCLSHQWQGKRTGGSDVRDVFASAFIHRLRPAQARMLTTLPVICTLGLRDKCGCWLTCSWFRLLLTSVGAHHHPCMSCSLIMDSHGYLAHLAPIIYHVIHRNTKKPCHSQRKANPGFNLTIFHLADIARRRL